MLPGTSAPPAGVSAPALDPAPPLASIIIVNMNGREDLGRCLTSIGRQGSDLCEVIVVDNASTDGSGNFVAELFPWVRLVRTGKNLGYAGGNNVGFQVARGDYLVVINPDTEVRPGWLDALLAVFEAHPEVGLVTPKILMLDRPSTVNTCGNAISITGLTFCRGLDEPAEAYGEIESVSAVSGAAFAIRRAVLEEIGGFDDSFFMYYEETDLSLRAMLAGYTCVFVPTSIVLHRYDFRFSAQKCFYQERNRYLSLIKTLRWPTLLTLLPAFALSEVMAWGYAALQGRAHLQAKLRSHIWLITNLRHVLIKRQATQRLRRVPDRTILRRFTNQLNFTRTVSPRLATALDRTITPFLTIMRGLSRAVVWW